MQPSLFEPDERFLLPEFIGRARVLASDSKNLLTPGKGRTSDFDYTLNPYRGCSFDCSYCFAAAFVPDELQKSEWGLWVEAKVKALDSLASKELRNKRIFMSSATDPYQPLEGKVKLTRSIVEELLRQQVRLMVQTRSPIVERDIDLLQGFDDVQVNLSITTDDEEVRKRFEPSCASIDRRLLTISRLSAAGLKTCICVGPMLPMRDPEEFARRTADIGPTHVSTAYFLTSDKPFASNTRERALGIAEEYGWDRDEYDRAVGLMAKHLPSLVRRGERSGTSSARPGTTGQAALLM
ncbi:MAG: radical SAM protein [Fimbriimonas sp.]